MGSLKTSCFVQTQFLSSGSTGVGQWVVPITLCCCSYSRQAKFLFHGKQEDFDLSASGFTDCQKKDGFWIKLNVNQTSFYRVSYDEELAARLRYAIETNKLGAADRYGKFS
jgi:puromycin-sensitive aminopeptidase